MEAPGVLEITEKILMMPKYKHAEIPRETVRSLVLQCAAAGGSKKEIENRARVKLHNIVAPYLGDLDYGEAASEFNKIKNDPDGLREFCLHNLEKHSSTRERGRDIETMYKNLFEITGPVLKICDLACGIHPLGLPFMGLPRDADYFAYDLNKPRTVFLDGFIRGLGYGGGCFHIDILTDPPRETFDAAFFFKEAHRFEKRESGATGRLLKTIRAKKFIVSLPVTGMNGRNKLSPRYGEIVAEYARENGLGLKTYEYNNEIFYIIDGRPGA